MSHHFSFTIKRIHSLTRSYLSCSCLLPIIKLILDIFSWIRVNHLKGVPIISWKYVTFNFSKPKSVFKNFSLKKFADMILYSFVDINIQKRLSRIPSIPYFHGNEISRGNFLFSLQKSNCTVLIYDLTKKIFWMPHTLKVNNFRMVERHTWINYTKFPFVCAYEL